MKGGIRQHCRLKTTVHHLTYDFLNITETSIFFVSFKILDREFISFVTLLNMFESIVVRLVPSRCMLNPLTTTYGNSGL